MQQEYIRKHGQPVCACGCGLPVSFNRGRPAKFVKGHVFRIYDPEARRKAAIIGNKLRSKTKHCQCGKEISNKAKYCDDCRLKIVSSKLSCVAQARLQAKYDKMQQEYIQEHGKPTCACGCGLEVPFKKGKPLKYHPDHQDRIARYKVMEVNYIAKHGQPLCAKCGKPVTFKRGVPNKYCSSSCLIITPEISAQRAKAAATNWAKNRELLIAKNKGRKFHGKCNNDSIIERAFCHHLNSLKIKFERHKFFRGFSFDFYLIDFDYYIDCHGDYWHSLVHKQETDKQKLECVQTHGLKYRVYWEHEFLSPTRIKGELLKLLGIESPKVVVPFDEITISNCSDKVRDDFLTAYHYLGKLGRKSFNYTALHGDELLGVCCFATPTRNESLGDFKIGELWELVRFCTINEVHNMASWFLAKAIKAFKVDCQSLKRVISFADPTFGHQGTIYKAANWILDGQTSSSYGYVDDEGNNYHKKTIWNQAKKMKMSETDFALDCKLAKIVTLPKLRFVFDC